jgi:hypothetical protein
MIFRRYLGLFLDTLDARAGDAGDQDESKP